MKGTLAKEFLESDPTSMNEAFKFACKNETAERWAAGEQSGSKSNGQPDKGSESKFDNQSPASRYSSEFVDPDRPETNGKRFSRTKDSKEEF